MSHHTPFMQDINRRTEKMIALARKREKEAKEQQAQQQGGVSSSATPPPQQPVAKKTSAPPTYKIQQKQAEAEERIGVVLKQTRFVQIPDIDNFYRIMKAKKTKLSLSAVCTYIYLCDVKTPKNELYMSMDKIGETIGYTRIQVIRAIKELESVGLLKVQQRKGGTNLYYITAYST